MKSFQVLQANIIPVVRNEFHRYMTPNSIGQQSSPTKAVLPVYQSNEVHEIGTSTIPVADLRPDFGNRDSAITAIREMEDTDSTPSSGRQESARSRSDMFDSPRHVQDSPPLSVDSSTALNRNRESYTSWQTYS